jgi:hypothetical protein
MLFEFFVDDESAAPADMIPISALIILRVRQLGRNWSQGKSPHSRLEPDFFMCAIAKRLFIGMTAAAKRDLGPASKVKYIPINIPYSEIAADSH